MKTEIISRMKIENLSKSDNFHDEQNNK